jgi:hypothetical protein
LTTEYFERRRSVSRLKSFSRAGLMLDTEISKQNIMSVAHPRE